MSICSSRGGVLTNSLLLLILGVIVFLCIDQRLNAQEQRKGEERLYGLMRHYVGHVVVEDLRIEARRLAFAKLYKKSVLKEGEDNKRLLEYGAPAIEAYVTLNKEEEYEVFKKQWPVTVNYYGFIKQIMQLGVDSGVNGSATKNQTSIESTTKGETK